MKSTWKHKLTTDHFRRHHPISHGFARVFSKFELHRALCLALDHRYPFTNALGFDQIGNSEFDQVATAQLAVDCDVEQRDIAQVPCEFEPRTDCPDLFRQQRAFLSDEEAFVPGSVFRGDGGKLDSWNNMPSNPPPEPRHQHCADAES